MALGNVTKSVVFVLGSYFVAQMLGCGSASHADNSADGSATNPLDNVGSYGGAADATQAGAGSILSGAGGNTAAGADGSAGTSGASATAGKGGASAGNGGTTATAGKGGTGGISSLAKFSFFVTSYKVLQQLSKNTNGFGGDLRYGETGNGAGLRGADKICSAIAEKSMPGASSKVWRAFLSAANYNQDGKAGQVNAIDRIGNGPWYDRLGRVFSLNKTDLLQERPASADPLIINDFPNENGMPNKQPDLSLEPVDNHDFLTGTNAQGQLYSATETCNDWTTSDGSSANGKPRVGHSWPRGTGVGKGAGGPGGGGPSQGDGSMNHWMSALDEAGCAPGAYLPVAGSPEDMAPNYGTDNFVGSGGGYGGFYCFALTP
jgi:hypothetical protein